MINFTLTKPMYLLSQLEKIGEAIKVPVNELVALATSMSQVIIEDGASYHQGDIVKLVDTNEDGSSKYNEVPGSLTGVEGIDWLCKFKTCPHFENTIEPLTEVFIPVEVFYECTPNQWHDISYLTASVINRNSRLKRLAQLKAPSIILACESRMVWEALQRLEANNWGRKVRYNDGTIMRSLNDIGYSLANGWDKGMLKEFERREAELEDSLQKDESEN